MKVLPFTIPKPKRDALIIQEDCQMSFYGFLHRHEELQLSYIVQGEGVLIVGEAVSSYTTGNVIVLGSNVPHVFKSNDKLKQLSRMQSIFFTQAAFGKGFFQTEELKPLNHFLKRLKMVSSFQMLQKK